MIVQEAKARRERKERGRKSANDPDYKSKTSSEGQVSFEVLTVSVAHTVEPVDTVG